MTETASPPVDETAAAPPTAPQQIDPLQIAGSALSQAIAAFNTLSATEATAQNRAQRNELDRQFDRAASLARSAAAFTHAMTAREQLQLMAQQVQAGQQPQIVLPTDLRMPGR